MKALVIFLCILTGTGKLFAQTNFGIAYYKVPSGWKVVQQLPDIILEEERKDGKKCQIILSATEEVVIEKEEAYRVYRRQKSKTFFSAGNTDTVVRKENPYSIAFISQGTGMVKDAKMKCTFYSFTNKSETFSVQFISENGNGESAFSYFLKTLEIEENTAGPAEKNTIRSKAKGKPRGRPRKNPA